MPPDRTRNGGGFVNPPQYARVEHMMEHFGDVRVDPYYWLRDRCNAEVRRLLKRENASMESAFAAYGGKRLCRSLYHEMKARWKEDDVSLPYRDRSYWYYTRNVPNADHPLFCRRLATAGTATFADDVARLWAGDPNAPLPFFEDEVVFFDLNLFARELRLDYVELGDIEVSPDEKHFAATIDCSNGREVFTVFVMEITNVNYDLWLRQHSDLGRAWATAMVQSKKSIYTSPTCRLPRCSSSKSVIEGDENSRPVSKDHKPSKRCSRGGVNRPSWPSGGAANTGSGSVNDDSASSVCAPLSLDVSSLTIGEAIPERATSSHKVLRRIDAFDAADEVLWLSSKSLLYIGLDPKMRSYRVIYHDLTADINSLDTDTICYEESDEAFWISSLCFSADERYAMFTAASSSHTQVFIIPCDAGARRCVTGVPIVNFGGSLVTDCTSADYNHDDGVICRASFCGSDHEGSNGSEIVEELLHQAAVFYFSDRSLGVELDIDHHESLFGDHIGAWIMVLTSTPTGAESYRVAYALDSEATWVDDQGSPLFTVAQWHPLFTHDPRICVEGVECFRDYLLLSVRRSASSTVLLVNVRRLWERWSSSMCSDGGHFLPLSLCDDALDLRLVVCSLAVDFNEVCLSLEELHRCQLEYQGDQDERLCVYSVRSCISDMRFGAGDWRLIVTHPTIPGVTISCRMEAEDAHRGTVLRIKRLYQFPVGGETYRHDHYDATIVWVPSDYGFRGEAPLPMMPTKDPAEVVNIPVYLCWKKSLLRKGANPAFLTVYGSYGECCDVEFESERLALLDRGYVWGVAGVRGGGYLGTEWRDAGRKLQRGTTVNDFVSVVRYIQCTGWCAPGRLVTSGASAGGFVVAAAMNIAPELHLAVIASVPFIDCLTTLLDPTLPLTISEWEEFGNPCEDPEAYRMIRAFSPMDNIPPPGPALPHIMLLTAWQDTRVGYWESLAFTARLRERRAKERAMRASGEFGGTQSNTERAIFHYCDFEVGHGGATGRYQRLKELAREYAFALLVQETVDTVIGRP